MKQYNVMDMEEDVRDFAGLMPDTETSKKVTHMAKYMEKHGLSECTLGNLSMRMSDDLTEIKCNSDDVWVPIYDHYIDDLWRRAYYISGRGTHWYHFGNVTVARNIDGKHIALCKNVLRRNYIHECPICHRFFYMNERYLNGRVAIDGYQNSVPDESNTVYGYNYITGRDYDSHYPLCPRCRYHYIHDDDYTTCERCGQIIHQDDAMYFEPDDATYCTGCYDDAEREYEEAQEEDYMDNYDEDWSEQPINEYHGGNHTQQDLGDKLMFGAEYEILCFDLYDDPDDRRCFCDGLSQYGAITRDASVDLEIVTKPMTLDNLRDNILNLASFCGEHHVRAWNGGKCGLHVHINRGGIPDITKMYRFLQNNSESLLRLSGREDTHYCQFRFVDDSEDVTKPDRYGSRYVAINLTNEKTVEFRFFRNTTNQERLMAYFDFLNALFANNKKLDTMSWNDLIEKTDNDFLFEMFGIPKQLELPLAG